MQLPVLLLLFTFCYPLATECLRIEHLTVPPPTPNDTASYALLDCEYRLDPRDRDSLEVKWYFRYDPVPIYQWIPPGMPQVRPG